MTNKKTENRKVCNDTNTTDFRGRLREWNMTGNHLVYAVGCILMVIASFLPYVHTDDKNLSLMDGTDGIFFLMFAVLIFIFIVFDKTKVVGVLGLVLTYCGACELIHTYEIIKKSGQVQTFQAGYMVLLAGTVVILAASSYFVYRHGLENRINRIFDRIFPEKNKN